MILVHGSKLKRKVAEDASLQEVLGEYERWSVASEAIHGRSPEEIRLLTQLLNQYKDKVEPVLDKRDNSAQEVLQSSILEEFFQILFRGIGAKLPNLQLGPAAGFIDLIFNPSDVGALTTRPQHTIRRKDHDFVIGADVLLTLAGSKKESTSSEVVTVPAIAIECKRYLERNMLDECAGTAEKVKRATPYCLYLVVAEFLKMDDASPEISLIDEIYILRKQRNSERLASGFVPNPIDSGLVLEIYQQCAKHLARIWWDPASALKSGKAFGRPELR